MYFFSCYFLIFGRLIDAEDIRAGRYLKCNEKLLLKEFEFQHINLYFTSSIKLKLSPHEHVDEPASASRGCRHFQTLECDEASCLRLSSVSLSSECHSRHFEGKSTLTALIWSDPHPVCVSVLSRPLSPSLCCSGVCRASLSCSASRRKPSESTRDDTDRILSSPSRD